MLEWKASFEVGHPVIDKDHRELVNILNLVMGDMNRDQTGATLTLAFSRLVSYTKKHFATEERLMAQHAYPGAAAHSAQHAELIRSVEASEADLRAGKPMVASKATLFLQSWLLEHIMRTDKKLAEFLLSKSAAAGRSAA